MFLIDFEQGRMIPDDELKDDFATRGPTASGSRSSGSSCRTCTVDGDATASTRHAAAAHAGVRLHRRDDAVHVAPMVEQMRDPVGSMGNDSALAVLSDKPRLLYDYFKQLFAQVTNPPIDSIREEVIMSLECYIGPEKNLLDDDAEHCHRLRSPHPILTNEEVARSRRSTSAAGAASSSTSPWPAARAPRPRAALDRISPEAERPSTRATAHRADRPRDQATTASRSARCWPPARAPPPGRDREAHPRRHRRRNRRGARGAPHCLLIGYGADAINPYLAFEALWQERRDGMLDADASDDDKIVSGYRKASPRACSR